MTTFYHFNFNVLDLDRSLDFYRRALALSVAREEAAADGAFKLVYLKEAADSSCVLELNWLRDRTQPYDRGEEEFHLAFHTDEFDRLHQLHRDMGCICFENPALGTHFIQDPGGYWIEIVPSRK